MKCPYCDCSESKVIDSRPTEVGTSIRRRRECLKCEGRFTTYEKVETTPITVVKKDKSRQTFEREKIMKGLIRACVKRPVSRDKLDEIANDIEQQIANTLEAEITTDKIGQMILEHLRNVDEVAYIRFASVYRDFKDINSFVKELDILKGDSSL